MLGAIIGGAVGGTQGKKVHASTVPNIPVPGSPVIQGGQTGGLQSATSTTPSSSNFTTSTTSSSSSGEPVNPQVSVTKPAGQEVGSPA